jgi:hypothetical protein
MIKASATVHNFFRGKRGQRNYPWWFFYPLPFITISKTTNIGKFDLTIGWLFWTIYIKFK